MLGHRRLSGTSGILDTMTRRWLLVSLLAAWATPAAACDSLPRELVGEWATARSEVSQGALTRGAAIHLMPRGVGVMIGAPPPIGAQGPVTYDAGTRTLTLRLTERGQDRAVCDFAYDAKAQTLRAEAKSQTALSCPR